MKIKTAYIKKEACFHASFQLVDELFCDSKMSKSFRPPFSKGGGVEGQSPRRSPQTAKSLPIKSAGGGEKQSGGLFFGGNPRRGFPIILLLLCILPSDTYFFYILKGSMFSRFLFLFSLFSYGLIFF